MQLGNLDGITATAVLFMGALVVQSAPDYWHILTSAFGRRGQPSGAAPVTASFSPEDRDRLVSFIAALIFGTLVVVVARFGVLSAVGLHVASWFDGLFTVLVLAAGVDKLSLVKNLMGVSTPAPSTGVVEVSGTVKVTGAGP